jgi:hypothetical protein
MNNSKGKLVGFWVVTGLFCLQMGFTAYAELRLPQVAEAFAHLGFPDYFRVELSLAKLLGIALLLTPVVPNRAKEWAYAGFAIDLGSAILAHVAVGDPAKAWGWAAVTGVLWAISYVLWRQLQTTSATATSSSKKTTAAVVPAAA